MGWRYCLYAVDDGGDPHILDTFFSCCADRKLTTRDERDKRGILIPKRGSTSLLIPPPFHWANIFSLSISRDSTLSKPKFFHFLSGSHQLISPQLTIPSLAKYTIKRYRPRLLTASKVPVGLFSLRTKLHTHLSLAPSHLILQSAKCKTRIYPTTECTGH